MLLSQAPGAGNIASLSLLEVRTLHTLAIQKETVAEPKVIRYEHVEDKRFKSDIQAKQHVFYLRANRSANYSLWKAADMFTP